MAMPILNEVGRRFPEPRRVEGAHPKSVQKPTSAKLCPTALTSAEPSRATTMANLIIPLNDTVVVFLHRDDTHTKSSHVVQVTLKAEKYVKHVGARSTLT